MKTEITLKNDRRRHQLYLISMLSKSGCLVGFMGLALIPNTIAPVAILSTSFFIFIGIDAATFMLIMLVD